MGNLPSVEIGTRSLKMDYIKNDEPIDWKEAKNASRAKRELYRLFMEDKLILADVIQQYDESIKSLEVENKRLKEEINTYKSRQSQLGVSPIWSSDRAKDNSNHMEISDNIK